MDDIQMEVIDGRGALGIVILREEGDQIATELKGLRVDKLTAARLFYSLAKKLKAIHDDEQADRPVGSEEAK
ncbi:MULTISPECIES: hypothetical protein [Bacteria]|uniref:hypothetical protein n=1 Tax=Bacteria TaxID=2 RepID=UPI003C7C4C8F